MDCRARTSRARSTHTSKLIGLPRLQVAGQLLVPAKYRYASLYGTGPIGDPGFPAPKSSGPSQDPRCCGHGPNKSDAPSLGLVTGHPASGWPGHSVLAKTKRQVSAHQARRGWKTKCNNGREKKGAADFSNGHGVSPWTCKERRPRLPLVVHAAFTAFSEMCFREQGPSLLHVRVGGM